MNKKKTLQTVKVVSDSEFSEPLEVVADSIIKIANAFDAINNSRLSRRAVILLIQDATGCKQADIADILDVAPKLKKIYLK